MLKLYGSTTSPYVRRLRMYLAQRPHEFVDMQIFEGKDRETLAQKNPTLKIPMLEDDAGVIFDSRVIYRYLSQKFNEPTLDWQAENLLTLIDSANESFVQLMLLKRSDIDISQEKLYFRLQHERIDAVMETLNQAVAEGRFTEWNYLSISLYCLIDWVEFRQLHHFRGLTHLLDFQHSHQSRIEVTSTNPRG